VRIRPFICLLLALLFTLSIAPAHALEVRNVRFGIYQDKTRLVIDLDRNTDFRAFVLDNPMRMVIDLPSFEWTAGTIDQPQNAGVLAVRHGNLEGGTARIVFDMNRPVSIQNAFLLPQGQGKPVRLVIDFAGVPPSIFDKSKGTVFGELKSGAVPSQPQSRNNPDERMAGSQTLAPPPPVKPDRNNNERPRNEEKPVIVIDPGHGGVDPGASGAGLREKDVVLGLARALKKELEASGDYKVVMTRDSDVFIKLGNRVKFARDHDADLFISIHADSINNPGIGGASIYTLSETASDAQTAKLAARENKADLIAGIDLSVEDQDVANILVDLAMRDTMNQSKFFAGKLVSTLPSKGVRLLERPHRHAGFAVLKAPDVPSVLIEAGFMSNNSEAKRLNSSEHRTRFAKALHNGIDAYFDQVRKNGRI
jgi:N-acetylmuramoyl-L-alanine amidase